MKLYRPVLIESTEQAEALPIGMVLIREGHYAYQKGDGAPGSDYADGGPETAIGWSALVPIEAEEEARISETRSRWRGFKESRLVTPWTPTEEA